MTEQRFFDLLLGVWFGLAALVFIVLFLITAPYGRHVRTGWGPRLRFIAGWMVMELPSPLGFALWFALGDRHTQIAPLLFLGLWQLHYLHRAVVYPLRRRRRARSIPLTVVLMAVVFNTGNAYLNGRYLFELGPSYSPSWLLDPRFLAGVALFLGGWAVNLQSDRILLRLRKPDETGYAIPQGGLYRYVSCPNYFGEMVEWIGWAVATWSVPGLAFAVWTIANLLPRAAAHHRWYQERFEDYPRQRKRVIPFVF